jgi:hypothetical protein
MTESDQIEPAEQIAQLEESISLLQTKQHRMKRINRVIRRKLPAEAKLLLLQDIGSTAEEAKEILKKGIFKSTLKNSHERIGFKQKQLHKILVAIGRETKQSTYANFSVLENADDMRLEVSLVQTACVKTRTILKNTGFRWSRELQLWITQLTDSAVEALSLIIVELEESCKVSETKDVNKEKIKFD